MSERARNAKCSRFGRLQSQAAHLPPASLCPLIRWHSLSRMLKMTLEESDVTERHRRQSQSRPWLAQRGSNPFFWALESFCLVWYKASSISKSQRSTKTNQHPQVGMDPESVQNTYSLRFPGIYMHILALHIFDYILSGSNRNRKMTSTDKTRIVFQMKVGI